MRIDKPSWCKEGMWTGMACIGSGGTTHVPDFTSDHPAPRRGKASGIDKTTHFSPTLDRLIAQQ